MIVDSSNDATHFVVDALSGVSNGAELAPQELKKWAEKRTVVNRYFASLGYAVGPGGINVVQKPWCEGPYGRERQFLGPKYENRNKLTTDATARSEEYTSELQSRQYLVCRLLLEKKN